MKKYNKQKLNNSNLKNLSFIKANLDKSKFENSNIQICDFWEASLKNSNFSSTKIENCIFTDANLSNSNFKYSNLANSNFTHSNLKGADLSGAIIKNSNFRDVNYDETTKWPKNFYFPRNLSEKKSLLSTKKTMIVKNNKLVNNIVKVLTKGKGYYVLKNYFKKNKIQKAQQILKKLVLKDKKITQNLNNFAKDKKFCQKWITNLLNIDPIFVDLIQPKIAMKVFEKILGENFICGFYEANCLLPGARGQFPHIDYPYNYNYEHGENIPFQTKGNFLFNCQILVPLNDIDKSNG